MFIHIQKEYRYKSTLTSRIFFIVVTILYISNFICVYSIDRIFLVYNHRQQKQQRPHSMFHQLVESCTLTQSLAF